MLKWIDPADREAIDTVIEAAGGAPDRRMRLEAVLGLNIIATLMLFLPASKGKNPVVLNVACVLLIVGIWIEKGMGMVEL